MTSPPGLDLDALARYLAPRVGGLAGPLRGEVIPGGRSNLTYIVDDGERRFVVRRPPLAHVLPTAHDMAREYRVLSALQDTGIPVPARHRALRGRVGDRRALLRDGVDRRPRRPLDALPDAVPRHSRDAAGDVVGAGRAPCCSCIDIDPDAIGLADFGHPDGFLERQVRRWWQQWEASKTRELPSIEELRRRLVETVPAHSRRRGSCTAITGSTTSCTRPLIRRRIVAVIDWEMCTIGDPLCDVGLLCVYWADDDTEAAARALHGTRRHRPGRLLQARRHPARLRCRHAARHVGTRLVHRARRVQARDHRRGDHRAIPDGHDRRRGIRDDGGDGAGNRRGRPRRTGATWRSTGGD